MLSVAVVVWLCSGSTPLLSFMLMRESQSSESNSKDGTEKSEEQKEQAD